MKRTLGLEDIVHDKPVASWEDVQIMIAYALAEDDHQHRDQRTRLQFIFLTLIIADHGERIGVITRSSSVSSGSPIEEKDYPIGLVSSIGCYFSTANTCGV